MVKCLALEAIKFSGFKLKLKNERSRNETHFWCRLSKPFTEEKKLFVGSFNQSINQMLPNRTKKPFNPFISRFVKLLSKTFFYSTRSPPLSNTTPVNHLFREKFSTHKSNFFTDRCSPTHVPPPPPLPPFFPRNVLDCFFNSSEQNLCDYKCI